MQDDTYRSFAKWLVGDPQIWAKKSPCRGQVMADKPARKAFCSGWDHNSTLCCPGKGTQSRQPGQRWGLLPPPDWPGLPPFPRRKDKNSRFLRDEAHRQQKQGKHDFRCAQCNLQTISEESCLLSFQSFMFDISDQSTGPCLIWRKKVVQTLKKALRNALWPKILIRSEQCILWHWENLYGRNWVNIEPCLPITAVFLSHQAIFWLTLNIKLSNVPKCAFIRADIGQNSHRVLHKAEWQF